MANSLCLKCTHEAVEDPNKSSLSQQSSGPGLVHRGG